MAGSGRSLLGSLESKIMQIVWQQPDRFVPVREVLNQLDGGLAYTTVMTVMNRLFEKGLLRRRREGRAWSYRPAMSREAYAASTMAEALAVAEDRTAALLHFIADLDPAEANALRRLLDATERT
jgi:predicted transcriptional regulator